MTGPEAQRPTRTRIDRSGVSNITTGTTEYGEDEFGGNLFDEVDFSHPDEVRVDDTMTDGDGAATNQTRPASGPPPKAPTDQQRFAQQRERAMDLQRQSASNRLAGNGGPTTTNKMPAQIAGNAPNGQPAKDPAQPPPGAPLPGFVTGRSADKPSAQPFNPHAESPSIRRTAGINSGKSEPIMRAVSNGQTVVVPAPEIEPARASPGPPKVNFVNPSADMHRRVGMPTAPQSPMTNRNAYKPPTSIKRPAPPETPNRAPLSDTTNIAQPESGGPDFKKPKMEDGFTAQTENTPNPQPGPAAQ